MDFTGEEEPGGHVEVVGAGVARISLVDLLLELVGGGAIAGDGLQALEVVDLRLGVLPGLGSVVGGEEDLESPVEIALQIGDDRVGVPRTGHDGVAVR